MTGETRLAKLLASLRPRLAGEEYAIGVVKNGSAPPSRLEPIATVREAEGLTIVAPAERVSEACVQHSRGWALITLEVHSSLQAIGMMAEVARALADEGISTNAFAGYFHDHLLVQWGRRHDAVRALERLAETVSEDVEATNESGARPVATRSAPAR